MKRFFIMTCIFPLVVGYAQEKQEKGVFEHVDVQTIEVKGNTETLYEANAIKLSNTWVSDGFSLQGNTYSTGAYRANDTLKTISPEISLPQIGESENLYLKISENYSTERFHDYVLVSVSEDGGQTFKRICRRSGVTNQYDENCDLTPWAGKKVIVKLSLESDDSFEGSGWNINDISIGKSIVNRPMAELKSAFSVTSMVDKIDYLGFEVPDVESSKVRLYISTSTSTGNFVPNLKMSDLIVTFNGTQIDASCISLEQLNDYSNQSVDIAFLMDNSGSMQNDIDGVAANVENLVKKIGSSMDASAGIYRFGFTGDCPKDRILWNNSDSLLNITDKSEVDLGSRTNFINKWKTQHAGGSYEPYYSILYDMVDNQGFNFRKAAQKVIVLIGDETALYSQNATDCTRGNKEYTLADKEDLINKLRSNGFQVFTIINDNLMHEGSHDESFDNIASSTGGLSIDIENNSGYEQIINSIATKLKERYVLTVDLDKCGINILNPDKCFEISLVGKESVSMDEVCLPAITQPIIKRTESTLIYDWESVDIQSNEVKVGASVTDIDEGVNVESVIVYMANVQDKNFQPVEAYWNEDGYYADVPSSMLTSNAVICYYFRVNMDNNSYYQLSSPEENIPYGYWTVTVAPNNPPKFGQTPSFNVPNVCEVSDVCIEVTDKDNNLKEDKVLLYYRQLGSSDSYNPALMHKGNGNVFCANIPGPYSVAPGIQYFFVAEDQLGSLSYKGTDKAPLVKEIDFKLSESEQGEETSVVLKANNNVKCASFKTGDKVIAYFDNGCGGQAIAGTMEVSNDLNYLEDFPTLTNTKQGTFNNGYNNGDLMDIKLLRGGVLYDISTSESKYIEFGEVSVNLPNSSDLNVVYDKNWQQVSKEIPVSIQNGTDFGYSIEPISNRFRITNFSGCGDIIIGKVEIDNEHFTMLENLAGVTIPNGDSRQTFDIQYDGAGDASASVKIYSNVGVYEFNIEGHSTISSDPCDDISLSNPLTTESNHTIFINTVIPNAYLHVFIVDVDGRIVYNVYDDYIHAGLHELDLWQVRDLPQGQHYYIVVEREGMGRCANHVILK